MQDGRTNRKELAIVWSLEAEFCGKVTRSDSVGISEASVQKEDFSGLPERKAGKKSSFEKKS